MMIKRTLLVLLLSLAGASMSWAAGSRPNLVFLLADDVGYGDVHCLNPQRGKIATPHLDRLAAQGMTFTDAHSGSSVCTPTRYGLLTGRYAWRTRLQSGVLDGGNDEPLIAADRLTVAAFLKKQGYSTACIGKWHLGFQSDAVPKKTKAGSGLPVDARIIGGPTTRGFDLYFGCSNARTMSSLIENDRVIEHIETIDMLPRLGARAVSHIAACAKSDAPFFLYLPLTSPHTPIVPSAAWKGKSGLGDYADFVMQTDAIVGDVLAALDQHGLTENTLVLFTSDNGCSKAAGIPKMQAKGHYPSADLRGSKADIFDGGHRVPFIVRWPDRVKAGGRSAQTICLTDLKATCAEITGAKLPDNAGEDSVSILPALLGEDKAPLHTAVVHHSINGSFAIRQGKWKLAFCADSGGWSDPKPGSPEAKILPDTQLYDMSADIAESKNLQAEHPGEVARLTKLLEEIVANGRSTPGAKQTNDSGIKIRKGDAPHAKVRKAAKK